MDSHISLLEARLKALESLLNPGNARARIQSGGIRPDFLYLVGEVAERLRCGKSNVYSLIESGELATTRIGAGRKGLRVKGSDLLSFLDSRKEGGPAPTTNYRHLGKYLNPQSADRLARARPAG